MMDFEFSKNDIVLPENLPSLLILIGPCRTGTTALANVFIVSGIEAHMQPIKSARNAKRRGDRVNKWNIIGEKGVIFCKETLGPNTELEFFDPIKNLLDIGYPKEKIHAILMLRDPRITYNSWLRMWGNVQLKRLVQAFTLTSEIQKMCAGLNISHTCYAHEVIRDNLPAEVIKKLFTRLGIDKFFDPVDTWIGCSGFGKSISKDQALFFYGRSYGGPPEKFVSGIKERGAYQYREEEIVLSKKEQLVIKKYPELSNIYENFRNKCELALDVTIRGLQDEQVLIKNGGRHAKH